MYDDAGQGPLMDVREDIAELMSIARGSDMQTALDRILSSNYSVNGFNNCIG